MFKCLFCKAATIETKLGAADINVNQLTPCPHCPEELQKVFIEEQPGVVLLMECKVVHYSNPLERRKTTSVESKKIPTGRWVLIDRASFDDVFPQSREDEDGNRLPYPSKQKLFFVAPDVFQDLLDEKVDPTLL